MAPARVLVVGLGGGADAQTALAVAQLHLERAGGGEVQLVYGAAKWGPNGAVYGVPEKQHDWEELNRRGADGTPHWVGTNAPMEAMPHRTERFVGVDGAERELVSPLVFEVPRSAAVEDAAVVECMYAAVTPAEGWDVVIGVDSGGDVAGGLEDARDRRMLELLGKLVRRQAPRPCRFELLITGLCVDGENYFWQMNRKLAQLKPAFRGAESMAILRDLLRPLVSGMEANRTPRVILAAIDGSLASVDPPKQDLWVAADGTLGQRVAPEPSQDALGVGATDFCEIPQRHHKLADGSSPPPVVVPRRWATHMYTFDAAAFLEIRISSSS